MKKLLILILLPFVKILILIGSILFFVEKIIYAFLAPFIWILFPVDVVKFLNTSIIVWMGEHILVPFCKKCGIEEITFI